MDDKVQDTLIAKAIQIFGLAIAGLLGIAAKIAELKSKKNISRKEIWHQVALGAVSAWVFGGICLYYDKIGYAIIGMPIVTFFGEHFIWYIKNNFKSIIKSLLGSFNKTENP